MDLKPEELLAYRLLADVVFETDNYYILNRLYFEGTIDWYAYEYFSCAKSIYFVKFDLLVEKGTNLKVHRSYLTDDPVTFTLEVL